MWRIYDLNFILTQYNRLFDIIESYSDDIIRFDDLMCQL